MCFEKPPGQIDKTSKKIIDTINYNQPDHDHGYYNKINKSYRNIRTKEVHSNEPDELESQRVS